MASRSQRTTVPLRRTDRRYTKPSFMRAQILSKADLSLDFRITDSLMRSLTFLVIQNRLGGYLRELPVIKPIPR